MKPLFTVHAGEYLVGSHIESRMGKRLNVWIPSRDIGIDLLVTDKSNQRATSLQVKYGKDYLPEQRAKLRHSFRCLSWFTLNRAKLNENQPQVDFWVFVLYAFEGDRPDYLVIPTADLRKYLAEVRGTDGDTVQIYFSSIKGDRCWETRTLSSTEIEQIVSGSYNDPSKDFTRYLNTWDVIENKLKD
ncbi:MAG: hypothetical protein ACRD2D_03585 [Terriglobales bacterium]